MQRRKEARNGARAWHKSMALALERNFIYVCTLRMEYKFCKQGLRAVRVCVGVYTVLMRIYVFAGKSTN